MPVFVILIPAASFLFGAVLVWILNERKNREELMYLEEDMLVQVRERYQAYVGLEQQIAGAITQFDKREEQFGQTLQKQSQRIVKLKQAFDKASGGEIACDPNDTSWLESTVFTKAVEQQTSKVRDEAAQTFGEELAGWKQKLNDSEDQKRIELERQSDQLSELTGQVESMGRLNTSLEEYEEELAQARTQCESLIQEAHASSQERDEFQVHVTELKEKLSQQEATDNSELTKATAELDQQRSRTADLQSEVNVARADKTLAEEALVEATDELVTMKESVAKTERLETRAQDLAGRLEQKALELTTFKRHHNQFGDQQTTEIEGLQTELDELRPLKEELESTQRAASEFKTELLTSEQMVADLVNDNEALEATRQQKESELEQLKTELTSRQTEREEFEGSAQNELDALNASLDAVRNELEDAQVARQAAEESASHDRATATAELESTRTKLDQEQTDRDAFEASMKAELDAAQTRCEETQDELTQAKSSLGQMESSSEEQLQTAKDEINETKSELAAAQSAHEKTQQRLNGQLEQAQTQTEAIQNDLQRTTEANQESSRESEARCSDLETEICDSRSRVEQLETELTEATRGRAAATAEAAAQCEQLFQAESKSTELSGEISDLRSRCDNAELELVEHADEATSLRAEIETAQDTHQVQLNELRANAELAQDEAAGRETQVAELKEELGLTRTSLQHLETEQAEFKQQSEADIARALEDLESKTQELSTALAKYEGICQEMEGKAREITNLHQRIGEIEPELASARKEVDSLRTSSHDLAARNSEEKLGLISKFEEKNAQFQELQEVHDTACGERTDQAEHIRHLNDMLSDQEELMAEMTAVISDLNSQLHNTEKQSKGNETRISHLMRALEDTQGVVAEKDSTVEAAKSVLAELRPMFEALESQLEVTKRKRTEVPTAHVTDPRSDDDLDDDDDSKKRYWDSLC